MKHNVNFSSLDGKTIKTARQLTLKKHDDKGFLLLKFTDGTQALVIGGYGGYTGCSEDEYRTIIRLEQDVKTKLKELEPV